MSAQKVRAIVESKENFVWATTMEGICDIYGIENLGNRIAAQITQELQDEGLVCYPRSLPSQQQNRAVVMLKDSRFARALRFERNCNGANTGG